MKCFISEQAEADLADGRAWIDLDNLQASQNLIDTAFECFDRLTRHPELGVAVKIKGRAFAGLRFVVLSPPFNRWLVFYRFTSRIEVIRVLYGVQNWRQDPHRFF